jgi:Asp-tRNA(Asn)/Glu-tRNA(Gln) amidotransferase A subunit family amidase
MARTSLHYLELTEIARRIQSGEVSPVELTKTMLSRIGKHQGRTHAYATVTSDLALRQAQRAETESPKAATVDHYMACQSP